MIHYELLAAFEEIFQCDLAFRTVECILLIDLHHRKVITELCIESSIGTDGSLLLFEEILSSCKPFISGNYLRRILSVRCVKPDFEIFDLARHVQLML